MLTSLLLIHTGLILRLLEIWKPLALSDALWRPLECSIAVTFSCFPDISSDSSLSVHADTPVIWFLGVVCVSSPGLIYPGSGSTVVVGKRDERKQEVSPFSNVMIILRLLNASRAVHLV